MTDPLSIIAGVIGITTAAIQSSKVLLELVNDLKEHSAEVRSLSKDVHAFHAIVSSLNVTLEEIDVRGAIVYDEAITRMVGNLASPIENCQVILGELMSRIQKQLKPRLESKGFRKSATSLKWSLFTKTEIKNLQLRLEVSKSTLCSALDAVTVLCSMRLLARGRLTPCQSVKWSSEPLEASGTIRRLGKETCSQNVETQLERPVSPEHSSENRVTAGEELSKSSRKQTLALLKSFVQDTKHAFMSEDTSLHRLVAQMYLELGEQRLQMQQLQLAIEKPRESIVGSSDASNRDARLAWNAASPTIRIDNDEDEDSAAADIFFDCVSRFSLNSPSLAINGLHTKFCGSPDYHLQSASSFYLEGASVESPVSERIFIIAMKTLREDSRRQKYFLVYAETPRRWRKIIVSATFVSVQKQSAVSQVLVTDNVDYNCKVLPRALQTFFNAIIPQLELFSSVSSLLLSLREDDGGRIVSASTGIETVEDALEKEMSDEEQVLQDIEDLGCAKFLESEVAVISRISSSCYRVWVGSCECFEQKAPFASAGKQGENGFQDFFNDLKLLNSLRGCAGVAQLIGVVLDESNRHLRSYLYERPAVMFLKRVFTLANSKSEIIPWPIREIWAGQIIKAVSDVHRKGLVVGVLEFSTIGLRADGTAILARLQTSHRHMQKEKGHVPPEMRDYLKCDEGAQRPMMNFRTDIFQLGYILWLLAEHTSNLSGYLCAKSSCTKFPRYRCSADHTNPVELPACCDGIPPRFREMIRECRRLAPRARPTALKLAEDMHYVREFPPEIINLVKTYALKTEYFFVHCDECGGLATDSHYHCNICFSGNFDLCPTCAEKGIHCFDSDHRLMKRIMKHGTLIDGS